MKNKPIGIKDETEYFDKDFKACSATDCTGLIYAAPEDDSEIESYKDVYNYGVPEKDRK